MASKTFECNEGEYGFTHTFNVKETDGTAANISWADGARLVIIDENDGTTKLDITTNLSIVPNDKCQWTVQNGQTDYASENLNMVLHFTLSTTRLEKTYDFHGIITAKKV